MKPISLALNLAESGAPTDHVCAKANRRRTNAKRRPEAAEIRIANILA
jgi:hypothetical protein